MDRIISKITDEHFTHNKEYKILEITRGIISVMDDKNLLTAVDGDDKDFEVIIDDEDLITG